ncbi:hypothetical protein ACLIBH_07475 [Virgibacillus sp. W0430]|uniref:hypothetical protein n=1 Tax=Virgibacillus sp. W0430 TaxID=3391580 RepID=UPI003F470A57
MKFKGKKVYVIWETIKKTIMLEEVTRTRLVEIHSDIDKAWDKHIELNKKSRDFVSYSIEVQEVK